MPLLHARYSGPFALPSAARPTQLEETVATTGRKRVRRRSNRRRPAYFFLAVFRFAGFFAAAFFAGFFAVLRAALANVLLLSA